MSELQGNPNAPQNPHDTLNYSAYSLVLAIALGFIGAAFAEFELRTCLGVDGYAHLSLGALFGAIVFTVEWCCEIGPARWRPIVISEKRFSTIGAVAVAAMTVGSVLIIGGKLLT